MGTTSLAARLASLAVAATSSLLFVATAHATHEDLVIDGDLTDLVEAIARNVPGETNGGFSLPDTVGVDVNTPSCQFVNGFDVRHYHLLLDFKNPDGSIASDIRLFAGWHITGVIGDVDGDGNAD